MDPSVSPRSFKGTIFHVWKFNHPCRIYLTDRQVYFIRRAANASGGGTLVRDDDPTPPDQLVSKHADNVALALSDIVDPRIEPEGKHMSFGKNAGRWHFTRRGEAKETVVLFESPADARHAVAALHSAFGNLLRDGSGILRTVQTSDHDLETELPLPPEQAEIFKAIQGVTRLLGERIPADWQKVRCEVRAAASDFSPNPLDIIISDGDQSGERRLDADPAIDQAALHLARTLSPSLKRFPGLVLTMTRLEDGRWHNNMKLIDKR